MNRSPVFALAMASCGLALAQAPMQGGEPLQGREPTAIALAASRLRQQATTCMDREGSLRAVGDRFKVEFGDQGIRFIPALGGAAPHNMNVDIRLVSTGRGATQEPVARAVRTDDDRRVTYTRGRLAETYALRPDGVEQSFTFAELPEGSGDLVVQFALQTELAVTPHAGGLQLLLDGVGGMSIGGVTGIDANGRRCSGEVRYDEGVVALSLPADFVDTAALPLVVDPLIGSVFLTASFNQNDRDPDVAYDVTNDVYLVVHERLFSATDADIHGQRVAANGTLVGGRIYIETTTGNERNPAVANVNVRDHFVVVFERNNDVYARSINAATGVRSAALAVATGADAQALPDVGGESSLVDDDAICVWWNLTQTAIEGVQITVNSSGSLSTLGFTTLYSSFSTAPRSPRISKGNGVTGHHMVVFERTITSTDRDPSYVLINRNLGILRSLGSFTTDNTDQLQPDVDGDGTHWVCAWQTQEAGVPSKDDIQCRSITWDGTAPVGVQAKFSSPVVTVVADPDDHEYSPSVVMTGGSTLVGWTDYDGGSIYNTYFKSLDPFTCLTCESSSPYWLIGSNVWDYNWQGCSKLSGGGTTDDTLLVMETYDAVTGLGGDIVAQRWDSEDGEVVDFGGGCGTDEGVSYATCATRGNAGFRARVVSELDSAPAFLVVSRDYSGMYCGNCRLIPDPYTGFVIVTSTDGTGEASFGAAIPSTTAIVGVSLYLQWLISEPITPGCYLFSADMTNGMRLTIE